MEQKIKWIDRFVNESNENSSDFRLYREYYYDNENGEINLDFNLPLSDADPIATGLTAYMFQFKFTNSDFSSYLLNNGDYDIELLYENYYQEVLSKAHVKYSEQHKYMTEFYAELEFFNEHIATEKQYRQQSEKFYSECIDNDDKAMKSKIRGIVEGYSTWVNNNFSKSIYELFDCQSKEEDFKINSAIATNKDGTKKISRSKKITKETRTLRDIWVFPQDHYDNILFKLSTDIYLKLELPFITQLEDKCIWNKSNYGSKSYLSCFIYTCLNNKWIPDTFTSREFVTIIKNTFNIKVDSTPYKSANANAKLAKENNIKYLDPFKNYI